MNYMAFGSQRDFSATGHNDVGIGEESDFVTERPVYTLPDLSDAFALLDSYEFAKDELLSRAKSAEIELARIRALLSTALERAQSAESKVAGYDDLLRQLHGRVVKTLAAQHLA
jgi:hypothetical protein